MESVSNANRKLIKHFKKNDEPFFGHSGLVTKQIWDRDTKHVHPRQYRIQLDKRKYHEGSSRNFEFNRSALSLSRGSNARNQGRPHLPGCLCAKCRELHYEASQKHQ